MTWTSSQSKSWLYHAYSFSILVFSVALCVFSRWFHMAADWVHHWGVSAGFGFAVRCSGSGFPLLQSYCWENTRWQIAPSSFIISLYLAHAGWCSIKNEKSGCSVTDMAAHFRHATLSCTLCVWSVEFLCLCEMLVLQVSARECVAQWEAWLPSWALCGQGAWPRTCISWWGWWWHCWHCYRYAKGNEIERKRDRECVCVLSLGQFVAVSLCIHVRAKTDGFPSSEGIIVVVFI